MAPARQAKWIAPLVHEALVVLIEGPPPESFDVVGVGTVGLLAAVLLVLQTHVLFERDRKPRGQKTPQKTRENPGVRR